MHLLICHSSCLPCTPVRFSASQHGPPAQLPTSRKPQTYLCSSTCAGAGSRYGMALEVASVFPVITGAAFTQNNIHTVVRGLAGSRLTETRNACA